jgi:proprotein convertase subtilisin/kexin type 2
MNLNGRISRRLAIAGAFAVGVAACGGGDGGSTAPANQAPSASLAMHSSAGLDVSLDGSSSSDSDGSISSYSWNFGDGQSGSGAQVSHRYTSGGTYMVTLTVTDNGGLSSSASLAHTVTEAGDPLYSRQWHLKNTGQMGNNGATATAGEDLNVESLWSCTDGTCRGEGVNVAVVDDGLEIAHKDLQSNISTALKHRVYTSSGGVDGDPTPGDASDFHGTAVSGIIASRDANGVGGRGVAPRASLVGYEMQAHTTSNQADAMTYQAPSIAVSNNSWGPPDNTGQIIDSPSLWRDAIDHGLANGRGGLGTIYLWAGGNGHLGGDTSNYDGFANYRGVIAVGAVNALGKRSSYSETGANLWISGTGGEDCNSVAITSTDLSGSAGINAGTSSAETGDVDYTQCMNGTSSATPSVAGVVALMLQANPALTWRDVRAILAKTARQIDPGNTLWVSNAGGHEVNYEYGFGIADAAAAVSAARTWTNLPAQVAAHSPVQSVNLAIPDNNGSGVSHSLTLSNTGISKIEWVDVTFSANDHTYSGDLRVVLAAPSGTQSVLSLTHTCSGACTAHNNWRFASARHLDEPADGTWTLMVIDGASNDIGTFQSWQLSVYGH